MWYTYIDSGNSFEFSMEFNEARAVTAEDLLDAYSGQFYCLGWWVARAVLLHVVEDVVPSCCSALELTHLLKSNLI